MINNNFFSVNTLEKHSLQKARDCGFGLEIVDYLLVTNENEITEKHEYVSKLTEGFSKISFHGTLVNRDVEEINKLPDEELLAIYDTSYSHSCFHGINEIVFHSNYLSDIQPKNIWLSEKAAFWKKFLEAKSSDFCLYIENLIDDTPDLLAELHDKIDDSRFKICLDTGHACCNSKITLTEWVRILGERIEYVHLHNNDKISDKHWSLGRGVLDMSEIIENLLIYGNVKTFVLECDFEDSLQWLQQNNFL
jgi:sugar phosphate isomerase/epimerase